MFDELERRKFQRLELPLEVTVEIVSAYHVRDLWHNEA